MHPLDPRVVTLWRIQGLLRGFGFWFPVLVLAVGAFGSRVGIAVAAALVVAVLALVTTLALALPAAAYERFRYALRDGDLLVERGVLFRRTTSIPLDRIQHVDTRQGPVERLLGLTQVVVYTAAGLSADGSLPGLDADTASALRDRLARGRLDGRQADDGV